MKKQNPTASKPLILLDIIDKNSKPAYQKLGYGYRLVLARALFAYGQDVGEFARGAVGIEVSAKGTPRVYRHDGKEYDNPVIAQRLAEAAANAPQYKLKAVGCELLPAGDDADKSPAGDDNAALPANSDATNESGAILEGGDDTAGSHTANDAAEPAKNSPTKKKK